MNNYRYQKSFQFSNKAEDVSSVLSICMKHMQESEELRVVPEDIQSRVKWALTELLINGAKHAGTRETLFHFKLREKFLIIEKEDFGNPLFLKVNGSQRLSWPVAAPFLISILMFMKTAWIRSGFTRRGATARFFWLKKSKM